MAGGREPIFLGRETYRRRRLIDALRLLPFAGTVLFFAPLLGDGSRSTAATGGYVFAAWLGLILLARGLVRVLSRAPGGVGADPLEQGETEATDGPQNAARNEVGEGA